MNKELINIKDFFTPRRKRCLSVQRIEKEAGIPLKSLDNFLSGRRLLNLEHLNKLVPVLVDFGYQPADKEESFL